MERKRLRVLITVKTFPIPSKTYDELVCTAGVTENGAFVRLYPINFRDLPFGKQYKKYQWIEVEAEKHKGRDTRKESWRPNCETLVTGEEIKTGRGGDWTERARYVLANRAKSLEQLRDWQDADKTSLGIFRPKKVHDLLITKDVPDWKKSFKAELAQMRIFETRTVSRNPLRKVPFKFHYKFDCDDPRCKGHRMMIEDWEVGALFWRLVDAGATHGIAAQKVREKFLTEICGPGRETFFYVGTILAHPKSWVIIGVFYPRIGTLPQLSQGTGPRLIQPRMFKM